MNKIATWTCVTAVIICVITSFIVVDYKIWRMQHPTAPMWTYIVRP